ncbi:hypothetical protein SynRS9902_02543 [Synechococcus sp. RS9902]|nr:hypothetical protein SynRS9902_02543 [Synechococcus sp. RS9902]
MTLSAPKLQGKGHRKSGITISMEPSQRDFLEAYRRQQGLRSIAEAVRELIHIGSMAVTDSNSNA